ncbi:hypothetical protein ACR77J_14020 [Tissierella praeacuta]|uniref:hypothetical protein n=1 Tax=Tissierella praeacuta TaxID=43131 RepID=UPI003DA36BD2
MEDKSIREEIEKLKKNWERDPFWDLYETEGFEDYKEELKEHQERMEAIWEKEYQEKEKEIDRKANGLGLEGLYRIILRQEKEIENLEKAIVFLADGENLKAYRVINGYLYD